MVHKPEDHHIWADEKKGRRRNIRRRNWLKRQDQQTTIPITTIISISPLRWMINSGLTLVPRTNSLLNALRKVLSLLRIFKWHGCGIVRNGQIYNLFVCMFSSNGDVPVGHKSSKFYMFCLLFSVYISDFRTSYLMMCS